MSDLGGDNSSLHQNSNGSGPWGGGGNRGNGGGQGPWGGSNNNDGGNRGSSGGGQGPWGGGSNNGGGDSNNGGANVEDIFNRARRNLGGGGGGSGGRRQSPGGLPRNLPLPLIILGLIGAFAVVWWNAGGVRLVSPSQQLVVTFLGEYQTTKGEGLQIQPLAPLQRGYVLSLIHI